MAALAFAPALVSRYLYDRQHLYDTVLHYRQQVCPTKLK